MAGTLLAVDAYISRFNEGVEVGAFGPINLQSLTLEQPEPERIERISRMRSSYGQALDSYSRPQPAEVQFITDETAADILAMALLGQPAGYTQDAATAAELTFNARLDRWVAIGKHNLTAFSLPDLTEGTHYEVVMDAGLVKIFSGGATTDGQELTATYSATERVGERIVFGTDSVLQLRIHGVGVNQATGQRMDFDIWQANISPSGAIELVSDEFMTLGFTGGMVTPDGKSGPFEVRRHAPVPD